MQMGMLVIQMLVHLMILKSLLRLQINSIVDTCINQLVVLLNTKYS
uniref:Uncharacterized protein n=1 Tax=virus sp. ctBM815 TaxID=2825806 RepID=A0A8S5RKE7_9VIRU|nr:MAG TPA: hypothetical protein [virus sp. ctBM815]DAG45384.1 MAG TPA: hypothetical protein [Caudoviricetes sp.]